jgi:hypothetical protein
LNVKLIFSSQFRDALDIRERTITVPQDSARLGDVLAQAAADWPGLKEVLAAKTDNGKPYLIYILENVIVKDDEPVMDGMTVKVFLPILGG